MIRIVHRGIFALAVLSWGAVAASPVAAQDPRQLSLEVAALGTLRHLDLSPAQLQEVLRLSKGCASMLKLQGQTRVTPAFSNTLAALREALLADDSDRIDELKEKLESIMEKDDIQLEDRAPISAAARRQSVAFVRMLKPGQVMAKLELLDDDEIDPLEMLSWALERGKTANAAQWKALRDEAATDAAWLIAGSDETKAAPLARQIGLALDQHHGGAGARIGKTAPPSLEKQVHQWTGRLDSFDILRHAMEHEMAELLSNPRLPAALQHVLDAKRRQ